MLQSWIGCSNMLCSHQQKLTLTAIWGINKDLAMWCRVVWVKSTAHSMCPLASWGNLQVRCPQHLMGMLPDIDCKVVIRITSLLLLSFWALAAILPTAHCTPFIQFLNQYSGGSKKEISLLDNFFHSWGRQALIPFSYFFLWGKAWTQKVFLSTALYCLVG